jgi:hypothetical protein
MAAGHKTGGRVKGTPNRRTAAVEAAARAVAERFKAEVPTAFEGDGVAYLQIVYRDPHQPTELRMDAAARAARFERPTLAAIAVQQPPRPRLDVSVLSVVEQVQLLGLMRKVEGRRTGAAAISGEVIRD